MLWIKEVLQMELGLILGEVTHKNSLKYFAIYAIVLVLLGYRNVSSVLQYVFSFVVKYRQSMKMQFSENISLFLKVESCYFYNKKFYYVNKIVS